MQVEVQRLTDRNRAEVYELNKCDDSPAYFATHYCKTLDIEKNKIRLFPEYKYLRQFFDENREPRNEHDEKSRQMMISWTFMALFLHDILFKDNIADFITSRKEFLVDDGGSLSTPNSLMGRIRFMYENLPDFLKQKLDISYLKIKNPSNNSYIIGESSNPNAGRSGTWHRALMDEAALIPKSESIFASLKQACKTGLYMNSTPYGRGGCFGRIKFDGKTSFKKRSFHWKIHPDRDESWYQTQCNDMTPDQIARELDISYEKSIAGQIYSMFDYNIQVGKYPFNPELPTYIGWDFGIGNPTALVFIQEQPLPGSKYPLIIIFDEIEASEKTPPYFAEAIAKKPYLSKDVHGRARRVEYKHYGDPAGKQRQVNMKSWISWLEELDIFVDVKYGVRISDCIQSGQRVMPFVRVDESCVRFLECLSNYRHPVDDAGQVKHDGYEENWATHIMKAYEYYVINRFPLRQSVVRTI